MLTSRFECAAHLTFLQLPFEKAIYQFLIPRADTLSSILKYL
jgi:hypothetical protein